MAVFLLKVTFCKLKTSLSSNFVYNLQTFQGFCQVRFTILFQIPLLFPSSLSPTPFDACYAGYYSPSISLASSQTAPAA